MTFRMVGIALLATAMITGCGDGNESTDTVDSGPDADIALDADAGGSDADAGGSDAGGSPVASLVIGLRGTATGVPSTVPDIDGDGVDDEALCFSGLEMVEMASGTVIGTATDCLSDVTDVGEGMSVIGTTTFEFAGGTLVTRAPTSVRPTTIGSPGRTHITGSIPGADENTVLSGTGDFEGASGRTRLSGAVTMNPLDDDQMEITFDCLFVLSLDRGMGEIPVDPMYRVLALRGTTVGTPGTVSDIDGDEVEDEALCFTGLDIIDLASGDSLGTASDCLSEITEVGEGLSVVGTTSFNFSDGTLTTRGLTSVGPTTIGSVGITHITGAVPASDHNSVVDGDGAYDAASGRTRLSGAVTMTPLDDDQMQIAFDCIFIVSLD